MADDQPLNEAFVLIWIADAGWRRYHPRPLARVAAVADALDLGRAEEIADVANRAAIRTPWIDAAEHILQGGLARGAAVLTEIGAPGIEALAAGGSNRTGPSTPRTDGLDEPTTVPTWDVLAFPWGPTVKKTVLRRAGPST